MPSPLNGETYRFPIASRTASRSILFCSSSAKTLRAHDLVDRYLLWIHPVVIGSGKRLFPHGTAPGALRLVDSHVSIRPLDAFLRNAASFETTGGRTRDVVVHASEKPFCTPLDFR